MLALFAAALSCTRTTLDGFVCQPQYAINGTKSPWHFGGATWEGLRTYSACDPRVLGNLSSQAWCVTAKTGHWEDGWGVCSPDCFDDSCARITKGGKRCHQMWPYDDLRSVASCTKARTLWQWCSTSSTGKWQDEWDWCQADCLSGFRPPPSPPSPPPSPYGNCQRATSWNIRCLDRWHYEGRVYSQCTTEHSTNGHAWCMTYDEYFISGRTDQLDNVWGYCKPGCWSQAPTEPCHRYTVYGKPCQAEWVYDNYRHFGCTREDSGAEWCMMTEGVLKRSHIRRGVDWDYCAPGCTAPPPMSSPPPPLPPADWEPGHHPRHSHTHEQGSPSDGDGSGASVAPSPQHSAARSRIAAIVLCLVIMALAAAVMFFSRGRMAEAAAQKPAGGSGDAGDAAAVGASYAADPRLGLVVNGDNVHPSSSDDPAHGGASDPEAPALVEGKIMLGVPTPAADSGGVVDLAGSARPEKLTKPPSPARRGYDTAAGEFEAGSDGEVFGSPTASPMPAPPT